MIIKRTMQLSRSAWSGALVKSSWTTALVALSLASSAQAGLIAENAAVPATMTATGGTEANPSLYRFDNFAKDFGSTSIALGTATGASWIRLEIRNGATVTTTGGSNRIGSDNGGYTNESCSVAVTGAGSALTMGASRLGGMSPNNSLLISDGATVNLTGEMSNGYNNTPVATNNTIMVDDATINIGSTRLRIGYGAGHNFHNVVVRNGGVLYGATGRVGIRWGNHGDYRVEGVGSRIEIGYGDSSNATITLGEGTATHHNTVTVVDGGVIKLTNALSKLSITVDANQGGSGVRFADGIFAKAKDDTDHIPYTRAWLWDVDSWEPAPSNWVGTYYADETAAAAAGHAGFGGYTVFTGGESMNPPPPPAPKPTRILII